MQRLGNGDGDSRCGAAMGFLCLEDCANCGGCLLSALEQLICWAGGGRRRRAGVGNIVKMEKTENCEQGKRQRYFPALFCLVRVRGAWDDGRR